MTRAVNAKQRLLTLAVLLPLLTLPANGAQAAPALVAQWHMDELSGPTMSDSSGAGNDGTIAGGVTFGAAGYTGAPGDYAYGFDGSTSQIKVADSSSLNPGPNDITITMQIKTTVRPGTGLFDYDMVRKGSAFNMEIYPKGTPSGPIAQAKCKFNGSLGKLVFQAGPDLIDGAWHTLTCQKTSAGITLTVDGTQFFKAGFIGDIRTNSQSVAVGWQTNSTDHYNGLMDDVSIAIG